MIRLGLVVILFVFAVLAALLVRLAHEADGRTCTVVSVSTCHAGSAS
jgi:hypothetical protein